MACAMVLATSLVSNVLSFGAIVVLLYRLAYLSQWKSKRETEDQARNRSLSPTWYDDSTASPESSDPQKKQKT